MSKIKEVSDFIVSSFGENCCHQLLHEKPMRPLEILADPRHLGFCS
jgi:hypothetical protein